MPCWKGVVKAAVMIGLASALTATTAQTLGTFRWNLAPFCNVVTLTVTQSGAGHTAVGSDDGCGLSQVSPVSATLLLLPNNNTASGTLTTYMPNQAPVFTNIQLTLSTGNGNWNDTAGNQGTFVFNPATAPGLQRPIDGELWAYVTSNGGLHATSGNLTVTRPATGEYCVVIKKRSSHKAAQATLADPGGNKIVSVGTGHGSKCNPLVTATHDAIPVYIRTTAGVAVDDNFTISVPRR